MAKPEFEARHLQLGYVAGAHGVHGAVRVKLFNPESTTLAPGAEVVLRARSGGAGRSIEVTRVAPKPGSELARVWLAGVDSRPDAEALRGMEVWIDRAKLPDLDEDEYYLADLVGLEVVRGEVRESLGEVTGITTNTAQDLLCVRLRGREWLLPALPPFIVEIDRDAGQLVVDVHDDMLPDGVDQ
jgi:16S rRNA processing protein RimM